MKKLIVSMMTAGALAAGGAASAQDFGLGNVLPQILGSIGLGGVVQQGQYGPGTVYESGGRYVYVVPETGQHVVLDGQRTYRDQFGRRIHVTGLGTREVVVEDNTVNQGTIFGRSSVYGVQPGQYGSYRDQYGRLVYLGADGRPQYVEQNGQLIPYGTVYGQLGPRDDLDGDGIRNRRDRDRDGDGVRNRDDRYPDDPRYR